MDLRLDTVYDRDFPRWIKLSYRKKEGGRPPAITFSLTEGCASGIEPLLKKTRFAEEYEETFSLSKYEPDLTKAFGFDGAMKYEGTSKGYVHLSMPLDRKKDIYALSASASILCSLTHYYLKESQQGADASCTQLMMLQPGLRLEQQFRGFHGAPLAGETSPRFTAWLKEKHKKRDPFAEVDEAIFEAYNVFIPKENPDTPRWLRSRSSIKSLKSVCRFCYGESGSFGLHCPGNACDIGTHPDYLYREAGDAGRQFGCHNLDFPQQQLALMAGLAKLYDLAAQDLDPKPPLS